MPKQHGPEPVLTQGEMSLELLTEYINTLDKACDGFAPDHADPRLDDTSAARSESRIDRGSRVTGLVKRLLCLGVREIETVRAALPACMARERKEATLT